MNTLTMMDLLIFESQNSAYIRAVETSFGALGQPLSKPDRLLVGQGRLMKKSRTRWQLKSFFLFNDVLVYGSVLPVLNWHKKQKIIALGKKTPLRISYRSFINYLFQRAQLKKK